MKRGSKLFRSVKGNERKRKVMLGHAQMTWKKASKLIKDNWLPVRISKIMKTKWTKISGNWGKFVRSLQLPVNNW
jgi:hypothetical protein